MMKLTSKALTRAICLAIASVGFVANAYAADSAAAADENAIDTYHLAEVVVHGQRYIAGEFVRATSNIGILGEQDAMSSPISTTTLSEKAVGSFLSSTEGLSKVLSLVPSVVKTYDSAVDCITIRGFDDSGRGFMINGIPGMQAMTRQSSNFIDSIDVIEGPSTGITGSAVYNRDGGTININSKKALADEDTRKVGIKYHSKGSHEEYVDAGGRFGENKRYGIRINASNTNGERSIENWDLEQRNIYINLDQETEDSKTNFMVGYTYTDSQGRPYGLTVSSSFVGNALPSAPDGDTNFNPVWRRDKNTNFVMTLNHEQKINEHLKAFLNAGHFKQDWYYYTGFSKTLLNEAGDFKASSDNYSLLEKRDYAQIGLRGDFKTGDLTHNYVFGVDRMWHYYGGAKDYQEEDGWTGNIYNVNTSLWAPPSFSQSDAYYGTHTRASSWSIMDSIKTGNEKLNILLGLTGKSIDKDSYKTDGSHKKKAGDYYDVSPSFGINYTFSPRLAVFANHTEEFVEGAVVGSGYTNQGNTLDPYKTKQTEFGIKAKTGDFFHKLSYFDIKKANSMDQFNADGTKTLTQDGERRHKGIEYTATGTLAEKWNLIGGFMYLDAEQKTSSAASNGKRPNGIPEWTANLGVEYKASDAFSALVRGNYVGSSYVQNEKFGVPSYFTLDAGVKAKTEFNGTPVTLSAMCYNVTDKNYWTASGNVLHLGGPRTFMLSAEFEL
ncbi:MAG: TonB-dependent receptor [Phascolarctobacterium sp.]|nr:TonB-dependent receptor [Phascolarctobacterium sp.]